MTKAEGDERQQVVLDGSDVPAFSAASTAVPAFQHSRRRRSRLQQALWRCRVSAPAVQVLNSGGAGCSRFQPWVEVKAFSKSLESFKTAIVVGGTNISDQRSELRAGVDIVVATPGRFIDHL
ncbi:DEAD-box ATP-dependent RNA helicase 41-like isoform X1 [Humulus lupulus]|uniref:DEAD-box ATP-dependent RNA helicase 41-like isoform X1 n=1 Tax=Humulus lupulus TaxID=3486 RepID=UPI002B40C469|nr:DEAD-box ATP-dependent RNA helicase 41-like isoform X1 [Humulus lupulus]